MRNPSGQGKIGDWLWIEPGVTTRRAEETGADVGAAGAVGNPGELEVRVAATVAVTAGAADSGARSLPSQKLRGVEQGPPGHDRRIGLRLAKAGRRLPGERRRFVTGRDPNQRLNRAIARRASYTADPGQRRRCDQEAERWDSAIHWRNSSA